MSLASLDVQSLERVMCILLVQSNVSVNMSAVCTFKSLSVGPAVLSSPAGGLSGLGGAVRVGAVD